MKTIIAEKPSVAREIAATLNVSEAKQGYIEGGDYYITWAFGHLVELCPPEEYGWTGKWSAEQLPIQPASFKIRPTHRYNAIDRSWYIDDGVKKQLLVIRKLFEASEEVIAATDAGREGELIFRYIYEYLDIKIPFKRLWISSLTRGAIMKGFVELSAGSKYDNLYQSAKARSEADWLVGMNASRALSIAAGKGTFSLGRVQTPTLAMICERFLEHKNFVPKPFYRVRIALSKNGQLFAASSAVVDDKAQAGLLLKQVDSADFATVTSVEKKEVTEHPPLLHDLTSLQREANKQHGLSADETLKAAQTLYEQKLITYPRTGSNYIPEDIFKTIPELLTTIESHPVFGGYAQNLKNQVLNRKSVNDAKVTDHHAILVTENLPTNLPAHGAVVYGLIITRMLRAFYPSCVKDNTKVTLECNGADFLAYGSIIKIAGWKEVSDKSVPAGDDQKEEAEDDAQVLPALEQGKKVAKTAQELLSKMTKPKPILTEDLLLGAMESCGREIEDETLREALKICGIGTPATRASVVETLLHRDYIERKKKLLIPTPRGLSIYALLKDKPIASPSLTGEWEKRLNHISMGVEDSVAFMNDINAYVKDITSDLLSFSSVLDQADLSGDNSQKLACPKCKMDLKKGEKNYYCSGYKAGCDFKIWLTISNKRISDAQIKMLVEKGKTNVIKGFISKAENHFDAALKLDAFKVVFDFGTDNRKNGTG